MYSIPRIVKNMRDALNNQELLDRIIDEVTQYYKDNTGIVYINFYENGQHELRTEMSVTDSIPIYVDSNDSTPYSQQVNDMLEETIKVLSHLKR